MTPRIYVACLASYNSGTLHGEWIDVDGDVDSLREQIAAMLARSAEPGAEEWAIHDSDGWGSYKVEEWHDLSELCAVAEAMQEHSPDLLTAAVDYAGSLEDGVTWIRDRYQGHYRSLEDWAEHYLDDTGALCDVPESFRGYIDVERWGRDAELAGDVCTIDARDGGVYVFNG